MIQGWKKGGLISEKTASEKLAYLLRKGKNLTREGDEDNGETKTLICYSSRLPVELMTGLNVKGVWSTSVKKELKVG